MNLVHLSERRTRLVSQVLDRLLLYLRIVHSVDYYNHSEYPNEDEMPNRCGIMHARGIPPSSKVGTQGGPKTQVVSVVLRTDFFLLFCCLHVALQR